MAWAGLGQLVQNLTSKFATNLVFHFICPILIWSSQEVLMLKMLMNLCYG